tara:strand:+ start:604 stop:1020 length:417 start_codon:yes stop_codon:yes gene_type:complete
MDNLILVHGGTIPFICHVFLIFFGGFMSLSIIFNPNFVKGMGFESVEAKFLGRGLGFSILAITLVFIATLFQWGRFTSFFEIYAVLFMFTLFAFLNQLLMYLKILKTHNDQPVPMANVIRPLIPLIVIIIRRLTSANF